MEKLFHKILVPVDFSFRSVKAVEKAIATAAAYKCSITLLHAVTQHPFATIALTEGHTQVPYDLIDNRTELEYQLAKLVDHALKKVNGFIPVHTAIVHGHWDDAVIDYVNRYSIDCVMVGQRSRFQRKRKLLLNPDKVAASTHVPVITIPVNKNITRVKKIVVPVTDFLPVRKLQYAEYIARYSKATVELLVIEQETRQQVTGNYVQTAMEWLRSCGARVKVAFVKHTNTAAAVRDYAAQKGADLLILNPGVQTTLPGWWSSLLGNIIQKYSLPPVMTVTPS
jgi:nucleotide-binding universal stress UspA family protein